MMYGFGDDECPLPETADLMEVGIGSAGRHCCPLCCTPQGCLMSDMDKPIVHCKIFPPFLQAIVIEYASGVLRKALDRGSQRGRLKAGGKPTGPPPVDDILAVVRSDSKKALRVKELLSMQNYVRDALRALEDKPEEALADFVPEERGG